MSDITYPCPSCGFLVFDEPPGSYAYCEMCGWEDDHVQLAHPGMGGGANKKSLAAHQAEALIAYPQSVLSVGDIERSPEWRPLRPDEVQTHGEPSDGLSCFHAAGEEMLPYYWLRKS